MAGFLEQRPFSCACKVCVGKNSGCWQVPVLPVGRLVQRSNVHGSSTHLRCDHDKVTTPLAAARPIVEHWMTDAGSTLPKKRFQPIIVVQIREVIVVEVARIASCSTGEDLK